MKKLFIVLAVSFAVATTACNTKKSSNDEVPVEEIFEEAEDLMIEEAEDLMIEEAEEAEEVEL